MDTSLPCSFLNWGTSVRYWKGAGYAGRHAAQRFWVPDPPPPTTTTTSLCSGADPVPSFPTVPHTSWNNSGRTFSQALTGPSAHIQRRVPGWLFSLSPSIPTITLSCRFYCQTVKESVRTIAAWRLAPPPSVLTEGKVAGSCWNKHTHTHTRTHVHVYPAFPGFTITPLCPSCHLSSWLIF